MFAINIGDANLQNYYDLIDQGKVAINRGKARTKDDELRRSFILPLKNMSVNKQLFAERTGEAINNVFHNEVTWLKQLGLLEENDQEVYLTKLGKYFADEVATQFFNPDYMPFEDVMRAPQQAATG